MKKAAQIIVFIILIGLVLSGCKNRKEGRLNQSIADMCNHMLQCLTQNQALLGYDPAQKSQICINATKREQKKLKACTEENIAFNNCLAHVPCKEFNAYLSDLRQCGDDECEGKAVEKYTDCYNTWKVAFDCINKK